MKMQCGTYQRPLSREERNRHRIEKKRKQKFLFLQENHKPKTLIHHLRDETIVSFVKRLLNKAIEVVLWLIKDLWLSMKKTRKNTSKNSNEIKKESKHKSNELFTIQKHTSAQHISHTHRPLAHHHTHTPETSLDRLLSAALTNSWKKTSRTSSQRSWLKIFEIAYFN